MSNPTPSLLEVNGFKEYPLESSEFICLIELQKTLASTIKSCGASNYFSETFVLPMAAEV